MPWKVDFTAFDKAIAALEKGVEDAVNDAAEVGEKSTASRVPSPDNPGPYATGATQASAFTVTESGSNFQERKAAAQGFNPNAEFREEPTIESFPEMRDEGAAAAIFGVSTAYADIVEFHQPFMQGATDDAQKALDKGITKALKKAGFK